MYRKYGKRLLDIVLSIILIILFLPLMIFEAICLVINLGFPLHNEIRLREGKNKKNFIMYKFRTKKLRSLKLPPYERYTRFSRIIDRLRLNELPQLFNVFKGEMSLVGPRPFVPNEPLPDGIINKKRYLVRPGMTGLAQVNGGRALTHKKKLEYDIIYYDNLSLKNDIKIIFKTIKQIFRIDKF